MNVLLFDMYADGHHVEYAAKFRRALEQHRPEVTVDFLTTGPHEKHRTFFSSDAVSCLFPDEHEYFDRLNTDPHEYRDRAIDALESYLARSDYDVVHLLQVDYCLRWLHKHFETRSFDGALLGSINGSFFAAQSRANRTIAALLRSPLREMVVAFAPDNPSRNLNLARCLDDVLDHVFVHSEPAREHAAAVTGSNALTVVPDPLEDIAGDLPDQATARRRRSLPSDTPVLLYFGELRQEKGVSLLLESLQMYDGPPVTVVIAGKPTDVSAEEIEAAAADSRVTVRTDLGFVPEEAVPEYFAAADGILIPYRSSFGAERTSGVFQKAAGARRPVIAPRFGTFERRVEAWEMGLLFEPDSARALAAAISSFAGDPEGCYDATRIAAYARTQTYDQLAERVMSVYDSVLSHRSTDHSR